MDFSVACSSPSFFPYVSGGKWLPECYQKGASKLWGTGAAKFVPEIWLPVWLPEAVFQG